MRLICRIGACLAFVSALSLHAQTATSPTVTSQVPVQSAFTGGVAFTVDLRNHFGLPGVTNQVVRFTTTSGFVNVEMQPQAAPLHVANFLNYVNSGAYANSIIHRSAVFIGSTPAIIQGGGYRTPVPLTTIPKNAPVTLEVNLLNSRGTLAAARTNDINSATSEWYFNVADNSTTLGPANGGGYTVFGRVIGSGMNIVDAIAGLPRVNAGGSFTDLPVRNYLGGEIQQANLVIVTSITAVSIYPGQGTTGSVISFTADSSNPAVVSTVVSGSTLTLTPGSAAGAATITVRATDTNGSFATSSFVVNISTNAVAPLIVRSPTSQSVAAGGVVTFSVAATGTSPTYQWRRDNQDLPGANGPILLIRGVTAANAGTYTVAVSNAAGSVVSGGAALNLVSGIENGRLINLSVRSIAGVGSQTLTAGFVLAGTNNQTLVIRGIGPTLANFSVPGVLADPRLDFFTSNSTLISSNDNWSGSDGSNVGGFSLPGGSKDSVLTTSVAPGGYSAQVNGVGGTTGAALAEVYELGAPAAGTELVNLSARTQLAGNEILFGGFTLGGGTNRTVLIRAIGPGLTAFGVEGALGNPSIEIYRNSTKIDENDDWAGDTTLRDAGVSVGAFTPQGAGDKDSMVLITLPPGSYSAQVRSVDGTAGVVLLEVYVLN